MSDTATSDPLAVLRDLVKSMRESAAASMRSHDRLRDDSFNRPTRASYKAVADACTSWAEDIKQHITALDAVIAGHDRRVVELLNANNLLVARARAAEARIGIVEDGEPMSVERANAINGAVVDRYLSAMGLAEDGQEDALKGVTLSQMLVAREIVKAANDQAPYVDGKKCISLIVAEDRFLAAVCVLESYPAAPRAICTNPSRTRGVGVVTVSDPDAKDRKAS